MSEHDVIGKLGALLPHECKPLELMALRLLLNLSFVPGRPGWGNRIDAR